MMRHLAILLNKQNGPFISELSITRSHLSSIAEIEPLLHIYS